MDLDPFEPVGIGTQTMRFLDVFLLHCLLSESPPDTPDEIAALARNQNRTAMRGREPGLRLERGIDEVPLRDWGMQLLDECEPIAAAIDAAQGGAEHRDALRAARHAFADADAVPSARVLETMTNDYDGSYVRFVRTLSELTKTALLALPFPPDVQARFVSLAQQSLEKQKAIEAADTVPFEVYRKRYLSSERLGL